MKISIKKFATLKDVPFSAPVQISGANGAGKTSIMDAVAFCLTGKNSHGEQVNEMSYNSNEPAEQQFCEVSIEVGGHTYTRRIEPIFKTNRDGETYIATKCSTSLYVDKIKQDNADAFKQFDDYLLLSTDTFFMKDWKEQLMIIDQFLKSHLPDDFKNFDLKEENQKLKSAKAELKDVQKSQKEINILLRNLINPDMPEMSDDDIFEKIEILNKIQRLENKQNLELEKVKQAHQKELEIFDKANQEYHFKISELKNRKNTIENEIFKPVKLTPIKDLTSLENSLIEQNQIVSKLNDLKNRATNFEIFDDFKEFVKAKKSVFCIENVKLIEKLETSKTADTCPYTHVHSPECAKVVNENIAEKIKDLALENKSVLEAEFLMYQKEFEAIFDGQNPKDYIKNLTSKIDAEQKKLVEIDAQILERKSENEKIKQINKEIEAENEASEADFVKIKAEKLKQIEAEILAITAPIMPVLDFQNSEIKTEIQNLKNELEKFNKIEAEIKDAEAIINHNEKLRLQYENDLQDLKIRFLNVQKSIAEITEAIKNYSENIKTEFSNHFPGKLEIDIEVMEYIITTGDYNQTFFFVVNGKRFDLNIKANNRLNGALMNNAKIQILAGLQKLSGKNYPILIDNAEANTTQAIDNCGKDLITFTANFDEELKFTTA